MLPRNKNGDPEYGSVILVFDAPEHGGGVARVQSARRYLPMMEEEALQLLMASHADGRSFHHPDTQSQLEEVRDVDPLFVYMVPGGIDRVYVVLGSGGYGEIIDHPSAGRGSNCVADSWIGVLIADMLYERGGSLALEVVDLSSELASLELPVAA